jgi:hypothetical protein
MVLYINEKNKLYGLNYITWNIRIQIYLEGYNKWAVVSGVEAKPAVGIFTNTEREGGWINIENLLPFSTTTCKH